MKTRLQATGLVLFFFGQLIAGAALADPLLDFPPALPSENATPQSYAPFTPAVRTENPSLGAAEGSKPLPRPSSSTKDQVRTSYVACPMNQIACGAGCCPVGSQCGRDGLCYGCPSGVICSVNPQSPIYRPPMCCQKGATCSSVMGCYFCDPYTFNCPGPDGYGTCCQSAISGWPPNDRPGQTCDHGKCVDSTACPQGCPPGKYCYQGYCQDCGGPTCNGKCCPSPGFCGKDGSCVHCTGGTPCGNNACCGKGKYCADARYGNCCGDQEFACRNLCCKKGQICGFNANGGVSCQGCASGQTICTSNNASTCCNSGESCTQSKDGGPLCCTKGRECGRSCCGSGDTCLTGADGSKSCCSAGKQCGGSCCSASQTCTGAVTRTCCATSQTAGNFCCPGGTVVGHDTSGYPTCCLSTNQTTTGTCCKVGTHPSGSICVPDCPQGQSNCGGAGIGSGGACCPDGNCFNETCLSACPASQERCGTSGSCCDKGHCKDGTCNTCANTEKTCSGSTAAGTAGQVACCSSTSKCYLTCSGEPGCCPTDWNTGIVACPTGSAEGGENCTMNTKPATKPAVPSTPIPDTSD